MVKIDFEYTTAYGVYKDALYLPEDHEYTQEQIVSMQTERLNQWIKNIESPTVQNEYVDIDGVQYEGIEINGYTVLKPIKV